MIIGNFHHIGLSEAEGYDPETENSDSYEGIIRCIGFCHERVSFEPVPQKRGKGPDFIVNLGVLGSSVACEIGAAWKKTSSKGKDYLSVRLDSPMLSTPIDCALVEQAGSHILVWSRKEAKADELAGRTYGIASLCGRATPCTQGAGAPQGLCPRTPRMAR